MNKIKKNIAVVAALLLMSSSLNALIPASYECFEWADEKTNDFACEVESVIGPLSHSQWYNYWQKAYDICCAAEKISNK